MTVRPWHPGIRVVLLAVSEATGIGVDAIQSATTGHKIVAARRMAWLVLNQRGLSPLQISRLTSVSESLVDAGLRRATQEQRERAAALVEEVADIKVQMDRRTAEGRKQRLIQFRKTVRPYTATPAARAIVRAAAEVARVDHRDICRPYAGPARGPVAFARRIVAIAMHKWVEDVDTVARMLYRSRCEVRRTLRNSDGKALDAACEVVVKVMQQMEAA